MSARKLLATGLVGTVVAVVCCVTPVLVIALGAVGLAAWLGWVDYVLVPVLVVCVGITAYAWVRMRHTSAAESCDDADSASRRPTRP